MPQTALEELQALRAKATGKPPESNGDATDLQQPEPSGLTALEELQALRAKATGKPIEEPATAAEKAKSVLGGLLVRGPASVASSAAGALAGAREVAGELRIPDVLDLTQYFLPGSGEKITELLRGGEKRIEEGALAIAPRSEKESIRESMLYGKAPEVAGQGLAYLGGAGLASKLPSIASGLPAMLGGLSMAGAGLEDARAHGASPADQATSMVGNYFAGILESVVPGHLIKRLLGRAKIPELGRILGAADERSGGQILQGFRRLIRSGGRAAGIVGAEAGTETGQQWLANLIAKFTYAPEIKLLKGIFEDGKIGETPILGLLGAGPFGAISLAADIAEGNVPRGTIETEGEAEGGPLVSPVLPEPAAPHAPVETQGELTPGMEGEAPPERATALEAPQAPAVAAQGELTPERRRLDLQLRPEDVEAEAELGPVGKDLAMAELERRASTDALTGLASKDAGPQYRKALVEAARKRPGTKTVVVDIDADNFGKINKLVGHDEGDKALERIAAKWKAVLRPGDATIERKGGDEFRGAFVMAQDADPRALADRLEAAADEALAELGLSELQGIRFGASAGFSEVSNTGDVAAALRAAESAADLAARERKRSKGRKAPDMDDATLARVSPLAMAELAQRRGKPTTVRPGLPPRTADTMSDAIALSSPSGRMSKRARQAAEKRLRDALFGPEGLQPEPTPQPSKAEAMRRQATILRDLAARGMKRRAYTKEADRLEAEAARLEQQESPSAAPEPTTVPPASVQQTGPHARSGAEAAERPTTQEPEPVLTSARKAMTAADREAMGLNALDSPARRSWEEALETARAQGLNAPDKARRLAEEVVGVSGKTTGKPRAFSDVETAGIVHRAAQLKGEHKALMDQTGATNDPAEIATKGAEARQIEDEFDLLTEALRTSGTEKGRALAAQRLTLNEDYSLVSIKAQAKAAKGAPLTANEEARLELLYRRLTKMDEKVADLEAMLNQQVAEDVMARSKKRGKKSETSRADKVKRIRELLDAGCR